ncbi:hypothetical protein GTR04_7525 [Trichophyton interdigitale]|nr:hypothetical protein GY631_7517 [Trichophyton interdigitale]KAG8205093.1 hypothetical protein GTR04_7525 [Trichophyton interdigitale]
MGAEGRSLFSPQRALFEAGSSFVHIPPLEVHRISSSALSAATARKDSPPARQPAPKDPGPSSGPMTGQKRPVPRCLRGRCGLWALHNNINNNNNNNSSSSSSGRYLKEDADDINDNYSVPEAGRLSWRTRQGLQHAMVTMRDDEERMAEDTSGEGRQRVGEGYPQLAACSSRMRQSPRRPNSQKTPYT